MKTKNIVIIVCCMILSAFLLGATGIISLTSKAAQESPETDRLIGVFITREPLDLFDAEHFFNDNIDRLAGGGEIREAESAAYQGRLYADPVETVYTNDETGETLVSKKYVFNGVDGICFFATYINDASGSYWSTNTDEGITDGIHNFQSTDDGENISLKGTIFVTSQGDVGNFYFNPVYQTSGGEVYAVTGNGISWSDERTPGSSWSTKISESRKETSNDTAASFGTDVEVTVCMMNEPTNITLLQFNDKNELSARTEYRPGTLPESIDVLSDTQYIIVETASSQGLDRTLFQKEDNFLSAFYCRSDGICLKQEREIAWKP